METDHRRGCTGSGRRGITTSSCERCRQCNCSRTVRIAIATNALSTRRRHRHERESSLARAFVWSLPRTSCAMSLVACFVSYLSPSMTNFSPMIINAECDSFSYLLRRRELLAREDRRGEFLRGAEVGSPSVVMQDRRVLGSFWREKVGNQLRS